MPPSITRPPGKLFIHNPGLFDREGDSISAELVVPRQSALNPVSNYFYPENLTIDPATGEIKWIPPTLTGEYNFAFAIHEWRHVADSMVFLSTTLRDMQIIVEENPNHPPVVITPPDTCLQAGDYISAHISAIDEDNDPVKLESYSQLFSEGPSPATISPESTLYENAPLER